QTYREKEKLTPRPLLSHLPPLGKSSTCEIFVSTRMTSAIFLQCLRFPKAHLKILFFQVQDAASSACPSPAWATSSGGSHLKPTRLWLVCHLQQGGSELSRKNPGQLEELQITAHHRRIWKKPCYLERERQIPYDINNSQVTLLEAGEETTRGWGASGGLSEDQISPTTFSSSPAWEAPRTPKKSSLNSSKDVWALGCSSSSPSADAAPASNLHPAKILLCSALSKSVTISGRYHKPLQKAVWQGLKKLSIWVPAEEEWVKNHCIIHNSQMLERTSQTRMRAQRSHARGTTRCATSQMSDTQKRQSDGDEKGWKDFSKTMFTIKKKTPQSTHPGADRHGSLLEVRKTKQTPKNKPTLTCTSGIYLILFSEAKRKCQA
uniref:Uncharacterized protein n=1 Tax=Sus scrofa TaxID=9823 RepID=A0A8D1IWD8_PIG